MKNISDNIYKYLSNEQVSYILSKYDEPYRFYHTKQHIFSIIDYINNIDGLSEKQLDILCICAYFHDVVYNPKKSNNEEKSVLVLNTYDSIPDDIKKQCYRIIMDTSSSIEPSDELSKLFWLADRNIFFKNLTELIEYENNIFKEYQHVPYDVYKEKRIQFLNTCINKYGEKSDNNIKSLISYIKSRKPSVGIYAGSFSPFHIGHKNILEKANKIFDKVIIAFGNNPDKPCSDIFVPECIQFYQIESYNTLITDFLDKIQNQGVEVTLIRGIRNGVDLSYESNQVSFIEDIRPNTSVVYIPCDKQYEHISSTAIRNLMKFDQSLAEKYIV